MEHRKDELLSEILRRVQRNCVRMVEIERLTKELGDALQIEMIRSRRSSS